MSLNFLQRMINYNRNSYEDVVINDDVNNNIIDVTYDIKNSDDDEVSTLSVNTPEISEPSSTPEPMVEHNLKLYTDLKKICFLHKIKQINQDIKLRDDYVKKYYENIFNPVKINTPTDKKTEENLPTKLEIIEVKLTLMGLYCLGLTVALIFYK